MAFTRVALAALFSTGLLVIACDDGAASENTQSSGGSGGSGGSTDGGGSGGSGGGSGGSGGTSANPCKPVSAACYADGPEGPGSECLGRTDNAGQSKFSLRMSAMQVESPDVLTYPNFQDSIITRKIDFAQAECSLNGVGQFGVVFEVDTSAHTIKLGSTVPQSFSGDPRDDGTCFATFDSPQGIHVAPVTSPYTTDGNGALVAAFDKIVVPIYIYANDKDHYVLLPLNKVKVTLPLSADNNCVGTFNVGDLKPEFSCGPDQGKFAWTAPGRLEAFITAEEADAVDVISLKQTLCVVLSNDIPKWGGDGHACTDSSGAASTCRDCATADINLDVNGDPVPNPVYPDGDWCSTANGGEGGPADTSCKDAYHLVTNVAASAITVAANCP